MNLQQLYAEVSKNTDTSGTHINAAETSRVCSELFKVLADMPSEAALRVIAHGIEVAKTK
jgi:hypothetical protein